MGERRTLLRPLALLLVLCAAAFVFLKLAGEVREGETQRLDEWVLRSLRTPGDPAVPIGPAWLLPAARNLTALGRPPHRPELEVRGEPGPTPFPVPGARATQLPCRTGRKEPRTSW